jgi:hypothetical protein
MEVVQNSNSATASKIKLHNMNSDASLSGQSVQSQANSQFQNNGNSENYYNTPINKIQNFDRPNFIPSPMPKSVDYMNNLQPQYQANSNNLKFEGQDFSKLKLKEFNGSNYLSDNRKNDGQNIEYDNTSILSNGFNENIATNNRIIFDQSKSNLHTQNVNVNAIINNQEASNYNFTNTFNNEIQVQNNDQYHKNPTQIKPNLHRQYPQTIPEYDNLDDDLSKEEDNDLYLERILKESSIVKVTIVEFSTVELKTVHRFKRNYPEVHLSCGKYQNSTAVRRF